MISLCLELKSTLLGEKEQLKYLGLFDSVTL